MELPTLSLDDAVFWTSVIASIGIAYDALEFYTCRRQLLERFFEWRVIRSRYYILIRRPVLTFLFDAVFSNRVFVTLVVAHGLLALAFPFVFVQHRGLAAGVAAFVLIVHCLANIRLLVGRDGADQMQNVLWGGLFLYCLPMSEWAMIACAAFIAMQLVLSYLVSGVAKAVSPVWRSGTAIGLITRMATYCPPGMSRRLRRPATSFWVSWTTILFEVGAPWLLLFGRPGALAMIALGCLFHLGIAFTMGLTTFVFAFVAPYPIVYHLASRFS